jgi:ribose transport system permease protein
LLALLVVFSFASPYFLSLRNLTNVLLSVSVIGIMAAVSTLVVVSRGLDLSIGSTVGLVGVAVAALLQEGWPWWLAIAVGLVLGGLCGALNGAVIVGLRINSIITTIGTLSIIRGAAYIATGGQTLFVESEPILDLGSSRIVGIPYSVLLMLALFALCHFVADHMRIGRSLYAIGANPRASLISGLSLGRYRFCIFVASGIAAGLSGILLIGQSGTAVPTGGSGYELLVVTAVLLGGASLNGGEGRVSGTLIGVLIIGVLANGMTLVGVNSYYQTVANGVLLLAAVAIDQLRSNVQEES